MANNYSAYDFASDYLKSKKQAQQESGGYASTGKVQEKVQQNISGNADAQKYIKQETQRQQSYAQNIDRWTKQYNAGLNTTTDENGITKRTWTGQVKDPTTGKTTRQTVEVPTTQQSHERDNQ